MNRVAVLGRGATLEKYKSYSHLFDKIYIVARFYKEIRKMGIKYFKHKEIIHVVARTSPPLRNGLYEKLNIPYAQTFCHSVEKEFRSSFGRDHTKKYPKGLEIRKVPECMEKRGYVPLPANIIEKYCYKFDNYNDLNYYLKNKKSAEIKKTKRRTRYWPTTGIFALDLALTENIGLEEIYLFGLDLYTSLSYMMYRDYEFSSTVDDETTRLAFYHMYQLVKEYNNINFYSSSNSKKFNFNLNNWHLI